MKSIHLAILLFLPVSAWSLDTTEFDKKIKELNSADMKVRAAAIKELAPLFADLLINLQKMRGVQDPDITAAMRDLEHQIEAKAQKVPELAGSHMAANETTAAAHCKFFAEAQEIYHRTDYDNDGVLEYAQTVKGDHSLLEQKAGAGDICLVDKAFADAFGAPGKATPNSGYLFKILTKQGAAANGGARDYIVKGNMTLGYALIAFPAEYGKTGKNSYMINNAGTIYQKDLGAETHAVVEKMTEYDPDKTWVPIE